MIGQVVGGLVGGVWVVGGLLLSIIMPLCRPNPWVWLGFANRARAECGKKGHHLLYYFENNVLT